jgi:hypothetical protein
LLCLVVIAGRRYIVLKMEQWPESGEEVKKDSRQYPEGPNEAAVPSCRVHMGC